MAIRILIADDQTLMRDGLKTILDLEEDMEVVGTAENGHQALKMAEELRPDAILMDIRMPVMDGVESTRLIKNKFPDISVIMLTTFNDEEYIIQALTYGASGYLLKDMQGDKLIQAVREGVKGELLMPASVAAKLAGRLSQMNKNSNANEKDERKTPVFSERETEIARLIMKGSGNRQIADTLSLTEGTIKNYISSIYSKLGSNDRLQVIQYLRESLDDK